VKASKRVLPRSVAVDPYVYLFYRGMLERAVETEQEIHVYEDLTKRLADSLASYCTLISFGEARHWRDLPYKCEDRVAISKNALAFTPQSITKDLAGLFMSGDFKESFGGRKWSTIADLAHTYYTGGVTPVTYVDQVISLVHNGGTIFGKGYMWRISSDSNIFRMLLTYRARIEWRTTEELTAFWCNEYSVEWVNLVTELQDALVGRIPNVTWGTDEWSSEKHTRALYME
jgi:hypothetical protein